MIETATTGRIRYPVARQAPPGGNRYARQDRITIESAEGIAYGTVLFHAANELGNPSRVQTGTLGKTAS